MKKAKGSEKVEVIKRKRGRPAGSKNKVKSSSPVVSAPQDDPKAAKIVTTQDRANLETHKTGGVVKIKCMSTSIPKPVTIELKTNTFKIRPKTPFTCLKAEYEIMNSKLEGGLVFIEEVVEQFASKREAHMAESILERERFMKTVAAREKDGTIQGNDKEAEFIMKVFTGSDDEGKVIGNIDDPKTLKKMLKIAEGNGSTSLKKKLDKRILELETVA